MSDTAPVATAERSDDALANAAKVPLISASTPKSTLVMSAPTSKPVQQAASCRALASLQPATAEETASAVTASAENDFKRLFKFMRRDSLTYEGSYPPPPSGSARSLLSGVSRSDGPRTLLQVPHSAKPCFS